MVERLETELRRLPHLPERDVLLLGLAVGRLRLGDVRQRAEQLIARLTQLGQLRLELLELRLELARRLPRLLELRLVGLARFGGLLDLSRELVLLGADPVGPRDQLAAALIGGQQLVELLGRASPRQRRSDRLRIAADLLEVERGSAPRAA
jgi:hypothetical protein